MHKTLHAESPFAKPIRNDRHPFTVGDKWQMGNDTQE